MDKVTASTCEYGLARTDAGCVRTFASYTPKSYQQVQILSVVLGLLALCVASYKYVRSVRNHGAKLQQRAFLLTMFCSITFVMRGVDPNSYGHYIPRPISHFLVDACTAAIYTVFILTLGFWVSIINKGTPTAPSRASRDKIFEYFAIAVVWIFKVAVNVSLVWTKGFDTGLSSAELFTTAVVLFTLSAVFGVYGVRVIRRLQYIDKMNERRLIMETQFEKLKTSRIEHLDRNAVSHASTVSYTSELESRQSSDDSDQTAAASTESSTAPGRRALKKKPAQKIKEMLIMTEVVSLLCIGAQIYTGVQRLSGNVELHCANGFHCDRISAHWPLLHVFQYVAIWCILFTFRKTKRDRNAANAMGLARPVHLV